MKLGLYSNLARKDVLKARNYVLKNYSGSKKKDIHDFRKDVISGKLKEFDSLLSLPDFYSLSMCRDLCFHEKEHRFTINLIKKIIESNDLLFLGFLLPQ